MRCLHIHTAGLVCLGLVFLQVAAADPISDTITVRFNGTIINPGGMPTTVPEGNEAGVNIVLAANQVPAMATDMDLVLNEPNGQPSDVILFVLANRLIRVVSDTNGLITVPNGAKPIMELAAGNNVTNDLFPKGAGGLTVFVSSDADVPEPSYAFPLLCALAGFALAGFRVHRRSLDRE